LFCSTNIALHYFDFIPLNSNWLHETCLEYKLYILGRQHERRKLVEGRRGRWDDNIKIDVK